MASIVVMIWGCAQGLGSAVDEAAHFLMVSGGRECTESAYNVFVAAQIPL